MPCTRGTLLLLSKLGKTSAKSCAARNRRIDPLVGRIASAVSFTTVGARKRLVSSRFTALAIALIFEPSAPITLF